MMAAHLTCHNSDILPNSFPPPKPAAREYSNFMASEYQASSVMNNFNAAANVYVTGRQAYNYLEDDIPVLSKPVPTLTGVARTTGLNIDPQLCVTPEKKSPVRHKHRQHKDGPSSARQLMDSQLCVTPEQSPLPVRAALTSPGSDLTHTKEFLGSNRTVRFDQNIEIRHLSPVSSTLGTSPTSTDTSLLNMGSSLNMAHFPPHLSLSEHDSHNLSNSEQLNTGRIYINIAKGSVIGNGGQNSVLEKDKLLQASATQSRNVHQSYNQFSGSRNKYSSSLSSNSFSSSSDGSGLDSLSSHSSVEPESMEAIDIIASDLRPELTSRSKKGHKLKVPRGNEVAESVLARPEFSSTLRVRKEMTNIQDAELDLVNAVKSKLKTSHKTKTKLNEKAFSRVNQEDFKFSELPGIEVRQEDAIFSAEKNITAKAKPSAKSRNKPENNLQTVPDIMDFFDHKLQRETASFSLPGIPKVETKPKTAQLNRAFDVYRHIRTWENW